MHPRTPARNSTALPAERVAPAVTVVAESTVLASGKSWAEQELRVARAKIDARLFDQALLTLQALAVKGDAGDAAATEAYFMMASVHETQGRSEDAMAAYLEFAHRHPDHARATEALFLMAQNTLRTRRPTRDADARRLFSEVAANYPHSAWAPKALMMRAELEERQKLYQRDDLLGASVPSALVTYRQVATQYPATPATETALWKLGHLYAGAKRYRLAADAFAVLGTRYPATQFDAWYAAADLLDERLKDRVSARAAYMQVPLSSPRYRDAQKRLR
jgi:TolA-binding protein